MGRIHQFWPRQIWPRGRRRSCGEKHAAIVDRCCVGGCTSYVGKKPDLRFHMPCSDHDSGQVRGRGNDRQRENRVDVDRAEQAAMVNQCCGDAYVVSTPTNAAAIHHRRLFFSAAPSKSTRPYLCLGQRANPSHKWAWYIPLPLRGPDVSNH